MTGDREREKEGVEGGREMIGNWPLEVWERSHTIKTRGLGFVVKYCAYERDRSLV